MIPYTPQQNDVAKRKNRIIMEMDICMLGNLHSFLWGEAMRIAIYTLNRCPTKVVQGKTPLRHGQEENLTFLTLGCLVVKHSPSLFLRKGKS